MITLVVSNFIVESAKMSDNGKHYGILSVSIPQQNFTKKLHFVSNTAFKAGATLSGSVKSEPKIYLNDEGVVKMYVKTTLFVEKVQ